MLSTEVELLGAKLTAVVVGFCWTYFWKMIGFCVPHVIEEDWVICFALLLVEEMTDGANGAVINGWRYRYGPTVIFQYLLWLETVMCFQSFQLIKSRSTLRAMAK